MHQITHLRASRGVRKGIGWVDALVERARDGDVAAFEQLAERYLPDAYRLALGIVGPDDARDVAQDAMVAAWQRLPTLRDAGRFPSWLHTIVVNRARNALRARRRRPTVELKDEHASLMRADPMPEVHLRLDLDSTFSALALDLREVLVLHYVLDLPLREVARVLGIREGTVKSRLNTGLNVLRGRMPRPMP